MRNRIDKLVRTSAFAFQLVTHSLCQSEDQAKTREALVAAETSKKHLEEQVEQISRQLRGNEEKLAVYERRAPGAPAATSVTDDNLSREQQLEAEVAELRWVSHLCNCTAKP